MIEAAAFRWQGSSVNSTYTRLVAAGTQLSERMADQLRREFRMPDKRVAYLRLVGLALCTNNVNAAWVEIERMAFAKRPPVPLFVSGYNEYNYLVHMSNNNYITFQIIVKVYLDSGRQQQAADVIAKLPIEQRIRALVMIG